MTKPMAYVVCRWLDRSPFPQYKKCVLDQRWLKSDADLYVAVHSSKPGLPIDEYARNAVGQIIDLRGMTDRGKLTRLIGYTFAGFLQHHTRYEAIGLLDDDGYFSNPQKAVAHFLSAIRRGAGCVGPTHPYRVYFAHGGEKRMGRRFFPINKAQWTTFGSQVYSMRFIRKAREDWTYLLSRLNWRSDFQLFMLADAHGFPVYETYVPFRHGYGGQGSKEAKGRTIDQDWVLRRRKNAVHDFRLTMDFFRERYPEYLSEIERLFRADIRGTTMVARKWGLDPMMEKAK